MSHNGLQSENARLRRNLQITAQSLSNMTYAWKGAQRSGEQARTELARQRSELEWLRKVADAAGELAMTRTFDQDSPAAAHLRDVLDGTT